MPPSIFAELMYFVEQARIAPSLLVKVRQQSPRKHELKVPGFFIYALVESFRDRVDRGSAAELATAATLAARNLTSASAAAAEIIAACADYISTDG